MSQDDTHTGQNELTIFRGKVDSLSLYEITDYELNVLEKGSPNSIYLNFAILLLSLGFSFMTALFSTDVQSERTFAVFVILSSVGVIGGAFLLILWYRMKSEVTDVVSRIRGRIKSPDQISDIQSDLNLLRK